ncbi:hypothetical protein QZM22_24230 [Burkholderia oklahomensis]|uniref:hypothetical protein n=1 Tax=Burkholderia oklahomensis TaxID=342113 RepID=UPI00264EE6CA|nr:hypothetical protein [Burkholderia oklahomensis]MDN7675535.1 hypothetical protein [Burkholderia oklahomensis]
MPTPRRVSGSRSRLHSARSGGASRCRRASALATRSAPPAARRRARRDDVLEQFAELLDRSLIGEIDEIGDEREQVDEVAEPVANEERPQFGRDRGPGRVGCGGRVQRGGARVVRGRGG